MTLIEQANKIIEQTALTDDDITKLQKIKRRMSLVYDEASVNAGMAEQLYNSMRSEEYIKIKKETRSDGKRFTDNEANRIAKDRAERKRGQYRLLKAKAIGMKAKITAIEGLCLDFYTKRKAEYSASMTT